MLTRLTLSEMVSSLKSGQISAAELMEAHLDYIEKRNDHINAFTMLFADQARASARRVDQTLKRGPLYGAPLTVKDSLDVAGFPTRLGSFFRPEDPAAEDSAAVARLRRAGGIVIGKTNTPEFLTAYESDNFVTGRTNNPWDLERTPGGSSGGEAAAIAACMSPGGVGSDGGGSIRVPAHFCGIAGLKTTPGRIPRMGHHPADSPTGLGVLGPMARTVADVRLLFEALAGYDERDWFSAPVELRAPKVENLRAGVVETFYDVPVQAAVREAIGAAAAKLAEIGIEVEEFRPQGLERAPNLWNLLFGELPARATKDRIAGREAEAHWTSTEGLDRTLERPLPTGPQVMDTLVARDEMRRHLLEQMKRVPLLLMPVSSIVAFPHRARRFETESKQIGLFQAMMPVTAFNLLGLPALSIPFGLSGDGLPVGVQLVARPWEEETLLEVGVRLEEARGKFPIADESRLRSAHT